MYVNYLIFLYSSALYTFLCVVSDSSPNHQQPLKVLRDSQAFPKYVVNSAVQKIHQVRSS